MSPSVRVKLSLMMFLQYAVWGSWFVTLGSYLGASLEKGGLDFPSSHIGWCYAALPIAAMISPFFVGMIADRFFAAERLIGVLHLLGGLLLAYASGMLTGSPITTFGSLFPILLLYALTFMPTLALTNTLSFHQMEDPTEQFPAIRVWGTIGWIVAGTFVGKLRVGAAGGAYFALWEPSGVELTQILTIETLRYPMMIASIVAFILGVYAFFLPHTPPKGTGPVRVHDILGLDALKLLQNRSFAVFVIGSFLICIPLQFYYTFTNKFLNAVEMHDPAFKMTFGQWSEIIFMLIMPFFFARLGVKWMLLIGMFAWALRYFLFSMGAHWMLLSGIILHGICYDFFFVTGQIYVDRKAPLAIRGAAQGFIAFVTLGAGGAVGTVLCGYILGAFAKGTTPEETYNWSGFWLVPAILALIVMGVFAYYFKESDADSSTPLATEPAPAPVVPPVPATTHPS